MALLESVIELLQQGRLADADLSCQQGLTHDPRNAQLYRLWGCVAFQAGSLDAALTRFATAVELDPTLAAAWDNLRLVCHELGRFDQAEIAARRCLELAPHSANAANGLGAIYRLRGELQAAEEWFRYALVCDPQLIEGHNNLGTVLQIRDDLAGAQASYERAIELAPNYALALANLATVCLQQHRLTDACRLFDRVLNLVPPQASTLHSYAFARLWQGRIDEAAELYRCAMELAPTHLESHSAWLLCQLYRPEVTAEQLLTLHREFDRRHAEPLRARWPAFVNQLDPDRPLRVGFLSGDFGRHVVGYFAAHVLERLDRSRFQLYLYSERPRFDDVSERFRNLADHWYSTTGRSDDEVIAQMQSDQLDLLVDMSGHTAGNRIGVVMSRPAPVQFQWIGYPCTSGLDAHDFLVGDDFQNPTDCEPFFNEQILRQTPSVCCFEPPLDAPEVGPLPAEQQSYVTFGCLSNPAKVSTLLLQHWAQILKRLPTSRLLLRYRGWEDPDTRERLLSVMTREGIDPARIDLRGEGTRAEALATYQEIDIALDSYPYSGGMTTCEALWMGVPVITCPDHTMSSRHTFGHLSLLGLTDYVATSLEEYVGLAVAKACNPAAVAKLRTLLRARMRQSPLCDATSAAQGLERCLREAWRAWCTKQGETRSNAS